MIENFSYKHAFLSNFAYSPITIHDKLWATVEHIFQAAKTFDEDEREYIRTSSTPSIARRRGKKVQLRPDWHSVKQEIMLKSVRLKFKQNTYLKEKLLNTGGEELVEGNTWHDNIWGDCYCKKCSNIQGTNYLGKVLMQVRKELASIEQDDIINASSARVIHGDLIQLALDKKFDVIIHGCNCFCTMGAGIAKSIKTEFPEAYKADCLTACGDYDKLGTISTAAVVRDKHEVVIVNAYTQFHYRGSATLARKNGDYRGIDGKTNYQAIESCMQQVKEKYTGKRIGYPLIGAGLGGGDWSIISKIINRVFDGEDHQLVVLR